MKTTKKLFALILVVSLLAGMLAMGVSAEGGAQIVSQQLSLGDDLTMRFVVAVDSQYQSNAVISVAVAGDSVSYNVAEMTANENGNYQVYVDLAAAQMTDTISVQVKDGDSVLTEGSYSIRDYCVYILEGSYDDATKQMVKEVLNYGAAAQEYFQYNTGNPANTGYVIETTAQIPTDIENMSVSDSLSGISFYGATLLFRSKVAIRYYFSAPDGVTGYTFTANGKTYEATKKDELYYVEVAGINPQQLDQAVTLEVTDGTENTLTVSYSPLHYMARMSAKDTTSATLKALLTAMYSYHLEACEYVGLVETDDREVVSAQIIAHEIVGPWLQDRVGSSSIGPEKSYDGEVSTKWNPQATDFASGESIVYELDRVYDLTQLQVTVSSREFFFEVAVSADGKSFVTVHTVTEENMASVYTDLVCTLSMADADAVKYVKLTFLGSNASNKTNTFVNLNEVALTGREVEDDREEISGTIIDHEIVGTWVKDNATSASVGPQLSYDGVSTTKWNPKATNYKSGEGIIYTLDKAYDLTEISLTFGSRLHYFDLYVSTDGQTYLPVASITAANAAEYFDGLVATVDNLTNTSVVYVKVMFTGTENDTTWINVFEIEVYGKEDPDEEPEVTEPEATEPEYNEPIDLTIASHTVLGSWVRDLADSATYGAAKSYDGDVSNMWNPLANTGYTGNPGIVYTLKETMDIKKMTIIVGSANHYFKVYVSSDGNEYTQIAFISPENEAVAYTTDASGKMICTLDGLNLSEINYVKIIFVGRNGGSTYIHLKEVILSEEGSTDIDTSWMMPAVEETVITNISLPTEYAEPDISYVCDDGSIVYAFNERSAEDYNAVCSYYVENGCEVYSTFVDESTMAHVYWTKCDGELNVVLSDTAADTLPPSTPAVVDGEYETTVCQIQDTTNLIGMGYVVQLADGSYIVYDGSYANQAERVYGYLMDNFAGEGKPVIRAWVLTHSHNDHYPTFEVFANTESYRSNIEIEYVIVSPLNENYFILNDSEEPYLSTKFWEDVALLENTKAVFAHTGMNFSFCNLNLEILLAPESVYKTENAVGNMNDTSIVSRLYDDEYSFLILGDTSKVGSAFLVNTYGDYLKSNMCQLAHHGTAGEYIMPVYDLAQPEILFYPASQTLYNSTAAAHNPEVHKALEQREYVKEVLLHATEQYVRAWGTTFDVENEPDVS